MSLRARMGNFARNMKPMREVDGRIRTWRRTGKSPLPYLVWIEPTNACNLKCPKCPQADNLARPRGFMSLDIFNEIIAKFAPFRPFVALHHSGEPMMNERIFDMIASARNVGIYTLMATNATLLHRDDFRIARDGPEMLTFSIDAASAPAYDKLHPGGSWERLVKNVEGYFEARKKSASKTRTFLKIIVQESNRIFLPGIISQWSRYPFEAVEVDDMIEWPVGTTPRPLPPLQKGLRAFQCPAPWSWSAVLADGKIAPCCFDAEGRFDGGNLLDQSFDSIWNGAAMQSLRNYINDPEKETPVAPCLTCQLRRNLRSFNFVRRLAFYTLPLWARAAQYSASVG